MTEQVVDHRRPVIMRLDGVSFSTVTRHCEKPYDPRVQDALEQAATAVLDDFHADLAYAASDEISLVFIPRPCRNRPEEMRPLPYGGRTMKMCSIAAAIVTHVFARAMGPDGLQGRDRYRGFDARVFNVDDREAVIAYLLDRARLVTANSISSTAHWGHVPKRQTDGVPAQDLCRVLRDDFGIDWTGYPDAFKYGRYIFYRSYDLPRPACKFTELGVDWLAPPPATGLSAVDRAGADGPVHAGAA